MQQKVRVAEVARLKSEARKIVMVTAYDYPTGRLADEAGVDMVLVGDSLGNTVLGFDDTIPVRLEHMIHHSAAVRRGCKRPLLVGDMPFMTYKINSQEALRNAARLVQEGGCEAVKLEGGRSRAETIRMIVDAGIPVMGHIGLVPQSIHALSGYRAQGREEHEAEALVEDALALQEAGCFAIVLEAVTWPTAEKITRSLKVPTIGIGSGAACDGQVLVLNDLLGLNFDTPPRFVKEYADVKTTMRRAIEQFASEVRDGAYPDKEHAYGTKNM
ncbi:MAG: 3-methyl-2-oxobutanoate hydroxymethyltransferase [Candidatus Sumerlaeota bacterium]